MVFSSEFADIKLVIYSLAPAIIALAANTIFSHYFSGTGRPKFNLYASLFGLAVAIPALLSLVPLYGFVGAGISTSIAYTVAVVYQWFIFRHLTEARVTDLLPSTQDCRFFMQAFVRLRKKQL
jgi:O-antigen/teichoic acid export membrane protein